MRVLSLVEHLTRGDRSGERPNHFDTNRLVAALKGEPFKGYSTITISRTMRKLDATRPDIVLDWAAERLGGLVAQRFKEKRIALVPIPGHACTSIEKVSLHRVQLLALRIAAWVTEHGDNGDARAIPFLFWGRVMPSAHKQGGTRDPAKLLRDYRSPNVVQLERRTIVLVDDVVTTGARLCAAQRYLTDRGVIVEEPAFAMARTVHEKGTAAKTITQSYDPWLPSLDEDDNPF